MKKVTVKDAEKVLDALKFRTQVPLGEVYKKTELSQEVVIRVLERLRDVGLVFSFQQEEDLVYELAVPRNSEVLLRNLEAIVGGDGWVCLNHPFRLKKND